MVRKSKDKAPSNKDGNTQTQRAQARDAVGEVGDHGAGHELDDGGHREDQAHHCGGGVELVLHVKRE